MNLQMKVFQHFKNQNEYLKAVIPQMIRKDEGEKKL